MDIKIINNQYCYMHNIADVHNTILWNKMTFSDPNSRFMNSSRPWQGQFRKYDLIQKRCLLTFLPRIVSICRSENIPFSLEDLRDPVQYKVTHPDLIDENWLENIKLEDYQVAAIKKAMTTEFGIFKLTTGSGKTELIAGICKAINCRTIVLADMTVVVSQLRDRLRLREVAAEIGMFFAGERPNGEQIVVGSVQSLMPPSPVGPCPSNTEFDDEKKYQKALIKWQQKKDAFKTRKRNYEYLIDYAKKAQMLIVDECDRSASDTYKKVIRMHFKGRRKYGFCLSGRTILNTINGEMKLSEFISGDQITLLSGNNSYQTGTVIETGYKPSFEVSFDNGLKLISSKDHYLANDLGDYVRVDDIIPGQRIKIDNYRLIYNLENLSDVVSILDSSFNLCNVSVGGFEFSRSNFEQEIVCAEIDDILSQSVEFVIDSGELRDEFNVVNIHESHEQKLIGRRVINEFAIRSHVVSSFEFGGEFESTRTVSFRQCITDFLSDCNIINGVSAEFFYHDLISFFDISRNFECNGETMSFYHRSLDSFDDFIDLHRVFNTISLCTSSPPFNLVIEKLVSVPFFFGRPACYLIFVDGKPIINAVFFEHFLFVSFISSISLIDATRQIISALRAQMSVEFSDLHVWSIFRAFKNVMTVVAVDGDNVMIPSLSIVSSSTNNSHSDFSLLQGVKRSLYVCNDITTVSSVKALSSEKMYDIINVSNTSNFIANSIVVHNSATPYDDAKPIKNINVEENFGPIVFEMNRKAVEDRGRIIPCKYRTIVYEQEGFDLHNKIILDEATNMFMVNNQRFHDIVFGICRVHQGERNMILTERIPLGENLLAHAQTLGLKARFIYGKTAKNERDRIIQMFADGELDVLIGGKIVNRGLDIKGGVDNLIIATGGKLRSDFLQKIGRALRVNNRGYSYVYDFLFRCNHYLYEHSKARLETIIDADYESKVLFGYANLDGKDFVKRNFRPPARPRCGRDGETQKTLFH